MIRKLLLSWFLGWLTPEVLSTLLGDLFAALRAGALLTPTPVDDVALAAVERAVDKNAAAAFLVNRLRDLLA